MVMTPLLPDRAEACREVLRDFKLGQCSPLARIPDVHFARWVVIDRVRLGYPGAPALPTKLGSEYLLFSADLTPPEYRVDRLPVSFFRDLAQHMPVESEQVWSHCWGFPGVNGAGGVDAFVDYLRASQIEVGLYFAAFPDITPAEIINALEVRANFAQFVFDNQDALASGAANAQLQTRYLTESARWGI
jgi:hypothetical protein